METITLDTVKGVDIAWHIDEDGVLVIDHSTIPLTDEMLEHICPSWIREAVK